MSRFNPLNREQAFAYQLEDDVKLLHSLSLVDNTEHKESFKKHIQAIQLKLETYLELKEQDKCVHPYDYLSFGDDGYCECDKCGKVLNNFPE